MLGRRYKRHVPPRLRELISDRRLPRPNWFVGAAEQPFEPRDPALAAEIEAVTARIDARRDRGRGGHAAGGAEAAATTTSVRAPRASTGR